MADFPVDQRSNQQVISSFSLESVGVEYAINSNAQGLAAWPTANKAIYIPFVVYQPFVAVKMFVEIGTASGNIDVGIYDDQKNRLISIGGVAQAGSSAIQSFDITDTTLNPGVYYFAVATDNTTGTLLSKPLSVAAYAGACGNLMQTSAYPLPSPAVWVATVNAYTPFVAVTSRTVI